MAGKCLAYLAHRMVSLAGCMQLTGGVTLFCSLFAAPGWSGGQQVPSSMRTWPSSPRQYKVGG